ncbi:hypothetical protein PKCBPO_02017 [Methylorubrum thiocyanatum]
MDDDRTIVTDVELALADAEWRQALEQASGRPSDEEALMPITLKGEDGTALRRAFEERQRALRTWRAARGIP